MSLDEYLQQSTRYGLLPAEHVRDVFRSQFFARNFNLNEPFKPFDDVLPANLEEKKRLMVIQEFLLAEEGTNVLFSAIKTRLDGVISAKFVQHRTISSHVFKEESAALTDDEQLPSPSDLAQQFDDVSALLQCDQGLPFYKKDSGDDLDETFEDEESLDWMSLPIPEWSKHKVDAHILHRIAPQDLERHQKFHSNDIEPGSVKAEHVSPIILDWMEEDRAGSTAFDRNLARYEEAKAFLELPPAIQYCAGPAYHNIENSFDFEVRTYLWPLLYNTLSLDKADKKEANDAILDGNVPGRPYSLYVRFPDLDPGHEKRQLPPTSVGPYTRALKNRLNRACHKMRETMKGQEWGSAKQLAEVKRQIPELMDHFRKQLPEHAFGQVPEHAEAIVQTMKEVQNEWIEMHPEATEKEIKNQQVAFRQKACKIEFDKLSDKEKAMWSEKVKTLSVKTESEQLLLNESAVVFFGEICENLSKKCPGLHIQATISAMTTRGPKILLGEFGTGKDLETFGDNELVKSRYLSEYRDFTARRLGTTTNIDVDKLGGKGAESTDQTLVTKPTSTQPLFSNQKKRVQELHDWLSKTFVQSFGKKIPWPSLSKDQHKYIDATRLPIIIKNGFQTLLSLQEPARMSEDELTTLIKHINDSVSGKLEPSVRFQWKGSDARTGDFHLTGGSTLQVPSSGSSAGPIKGKKSKSSSKPQSPPRKSSKTSNTSKHDSDEEEAQFSDEELLSKRSKEPAVDEWEWDDANFTDDDDGINSNGDDDIDPPIADQSASIQVEAHRLLLAHPTCMWTSDTNIWAPTYDPLSFTKDMGDWVAAISSLIPEARYSVAVPKELPRVLKAMTAIEQLRLAMDAKLEKNVIVDISLHVSQHWFADSVNPDHKHPVRQFFEDLISLPKSRPMTAVNVRGMVTGEQRFEELAIGMIKGLSTFCDHATTPPSILGARIHGLAASRVIGFLYSALQFLSKEVKKQLEELLRRLSAVAAAISLVRYIDTIIPKVLIAFQQDSSLRRQGCAAFSCLKEMHKVLIASCNESIMSEKNQGQPTWFTIDSLALLPEELQSVVQEIIRKSPWWNPSNTHIPFVLDIRIDIDIFGAGMMHSILNFDVGAWVSFSLLERVIYYLLLILGTIQSINKISQFPNALHVMMEGVKRLVELIKDASKTSDSDELGPGIKDDLDSALHSSSPEASTQQQSGDVEEYPTGVSMPGIPSHNHHFSVAPLLDPTDSSPKLLSEPSNTGSSTPGTRPDIEDALSNTTNDLNGDSSMKASESGGSLLTAKNP
ncbi:hypothetical protein FRC02_001417 [Tulasnella sp. 418]|nr:hypothetical protein FRC02_001417 [Tulasnella sp. 418]